jgi:hypothetical protein
MRGYGSSGMSHGFSKEASRCVIEGLRGVQFPVAVTTVAALGDLTRFENPRQLMS